MTNKNILVSISCITFNHAEFLRDCLDGFLMQRTDFEFEVLIHDDASTDGTIDIIREYQTRYPNIIKPYIQTENQWSKGARGFNAKYNFSRALGKYFALCEGDDYWIDPLKLQKQVDFLETNDQYAICVHHALKIDDNKKKSSFFVSTRSNNGDFTVNDILSVNGQFAPTASYLFKKEVLSVLPKWMSYAPVGDIIFELYSLKIGKGKVIDETMSVYRRNHTQSWTRSIRDDKRKYIDFKEKQLQVLEFLKADFPYVEQSVFSIKASEYYYRLALMYLSEREIEKFKHYITRFKITKVTHGPKMGNFLFKIKDVQPLISLASLILRRYL